MAPSSRSNSGRTPSHRSSSSTLRDTTSGNSLRRAAMNNAAFNYGNPDEAAIMSASSVRYTASTPSLRSSSHSSHTETSSRSGSESRSQPGSHTQAGYGYGYISEPTYDTSSRTVRDSNVIRHRATTTVGSSGSIYRVAVVEPANSSSSTRSSRLSGDTMVASTRGPDSIRSCSSSTSTSRRGGDDDRLLMPPPGRRSGYSSREGGSRRR